MLHKPLKQAAAAVQCRIFKQTVWLQLYSVQNWNLIVFMTVGTQSVNIFEKWFGLVAFFYHHKFVVVLTLDLSFYCVAKLQKKLYNMTDVVQGSAFDKKEEPCPSWHWAALASTLTSAAEGTVCLDACSRPCSCHSLQLHHHHPPHLSSSECVVDVTAWLTSPPSLFPHLNPHSSPTFLPITSTV